MVGGDTHGSEWSPKANWLAQPGRGGRLKEEITPGVTLSMREHGVWEQNLSRCTAEHTK